MNNQHLRWSASCVASVQCYPSIPQIPTPGTCGRPSLAHACMPSMPPTSTLPSLSDRAAYDCWGFAAGPKTLPLPSTGTTEDALLLSLRATSAPRRFQRHQCHALSFHLFRKNVTGSTAWSWSSPVEWCNRFVSFGLGYALSWSGVSSCWVGWGVSRDLVRMSRLR